jgi:hypothetical protein
MKIIKNNIEVLVTLFIIFFVFVVLVLFYEEKLLENENKHYFDNSKKNISILVSYESRANDTTIVVNNGYRNYIELSKEIIDTLKVGSIYEIRLETTDELVEKDNLTKLFQTYDVIGVYEKIYVQ